MQVNQAFGDWCPLTSISEEDIQDKIDIEIKIQKPGRHSSHSSKFLQTGHFIMVTVYIKLVKKCIKTHHKFAELFSNTNRSPCKMFA